MPKTLIRLQKTPILYKSGHAKQKRIALLPSGLYRRYGNFTRSACKASSRTIPPVRNFTSPRSTIIIYPPDRPCQRNSRDFSPSTPIFSSASFPFRSSAASLRSLPLLCISSTFPPALSPVPTYKTTRRYKTCSQNDYKPNITAYKFKIYRAVWAMKRTAGK